jgi:excisionase family DNA binding protein
MANNKESPFMTPEECRKWFRLKSVKTIYEWIDKGKLPARRINNRYLIARREVMDMGWDA